MPTTPGFTYSFERLSDRRPLLWLGESLRDARFILRSWRLRPVFAVGLVVVLAVGLGSTTALFSVLDRILFRPLPYPDPDRLVSFGEVLATASGVSPRAIMRDRAYFQLWRPAPAPFQAVTSILGFGAPCDLTEEHPERLNCAQVEANFLDVLGVRVAVGRNFTAEDDRRGAGPTAILTYRLARRRFGDDRAAVGQALEIDGRPVRIVGVLPPGFEFPLSEPDLLVPQRLLPFAPLEAGGRFLTAIGRLKPGVTTKQAAAAITPLIGAGGDLFAQRFKVPVKASVRSLRDLELGDASRTAWLLLAASAVFLLIVCVNAAGLLLARLAARSRELGTRAALGASRARLARLVFAESILLSVVAGGLAAALSWVLLRVFVRLAPASLPAIGKASMDLRIMAMAAALALVCGTAVGIWPALSILRARDMTVGRDTGGLRPRTRFALIAAQAALTVALLGASGLLLRSLWLLNRVPLGFDAEHTLTMDVTLNPLRYPDPQSQNALFEQVLARVRAAPGTIAASWSSVSPLDDYIVTSGFPVDGSVAAREGGELYVRFVTPGYFETFRVPVISGRAFLEGDRDEQPTAIISESAERALFPGRSSLGHAIRPLPGPWSKVIGVVKDIRNEGLARDRVAEIYLIRGRHPGATASGTIGLRTLLDARDATQLLRQLLADVDPRLPSEIRIVARQVSQLSARQRFLAALLGAFGSLALLVAAVGLYAVASFLVTRRTRDIGVRMALGASPWTIARGLAFEAASWVATGAVLGYGLVQIAARGMSPELPNIGSTDAWAWAYALGVLAIAVLLALAPPIWRAARVDPAVALHME